jgi:hypothetical protein
VLKKAVRAGERNTDRSVKISRGDKGEPLKCVAVRLFSTFRKYTCIFSFLDVVDPNYNSEKQTFCVKYPYSNIEYLKGGLNVQ